MTMWQQYAIVSGVNPFPIDMLRYDRCYPKDEKDSYTITGEASDDTVSGERWTVTVTRLVSKRNAPWTVERWRSFIAEIEPQDHLTEKR